MTLHLYFARKFLKSFLLVFFALLAILTLTALVEQTRRFGGADDAGFGTLLALAILSVPERIYKVLPLVMILATIGMVLGLARSSELVVARAAGRPALGSLMAPILLAILIGALAVGAMNPIVAATQRQHEAQATRLSGISSTASVTANGFWLRQVSRDGQTVIRADTSSLDGTSLFGVTFLGYAHDGNPTYRVEAERAMLVPGAWQVSGAKQWRFDADGPIPEVESVEMQEMTLASDLTRDRILESLGTPRIVPIWDLPASIARLEAAGFSTRSHRMFFHMELALPLLLTAMVLVGASFTMRHARMGRTGVMVMMALGFGFLFYFIRNFVAVLGENGQIPVVMAAWLPPVAILLMPLALLLHLEDG